MKASTTDRQTRLERGARLRAMRDTAGLSQSQLAASMTSRYNVSQFETGVRDPGNMTLDKAARYAHAMHMDLDDFARTLLDEQPWPTLRPQGRETLRTRLARLGCTGVWLAKQTGLTTTQVSRYVNGGVNPARLSLERAMLIARTVQANLADVRRW